MMLQSALRQVSSRGRAAHAAPTRLQHARPSHGRSFGFHLPRRQVTTKPIAAPRHVQADAGVAGMGLIAGGILVTQVADMEVKDVHPMSIFDYLSDTVAFAAASVQSEWEDENRRVLLALIGANTAVFGLWKASQLHPRLTRFMWSNFACSFQGVASDRRVHTLLTSSFSHNSFLHYAVNMFMLWHFGTSILPPSSDSHPRRRRHLIDDESWLTSTVREYQQAFVRAPRSLNSNEFAKIYFTSAIASSVASVVVSGLMGMGHVYSIGASGAVFGIITAFYVMRPDYELLLYGVVPMTSDEMFKLTLAVNGVGALFQNAKHRALTAIVPSVDFVGHLGGQGAAYVLVPQ
ncbi:Aste57867_9689 [Aphanomyces stellatus]|uniref:Aste57867_9689 protein n=1 Tax=Aphanomyces stellatus TaxID=120398 RepID=A0A485KNL9_9STRA|nr:hypothetical protein As57867_009651 [Aphanomyces stellatus]VFT86568.1 Aste57867_9689 [Aphanomyces stellatus]